MLDESRQQLLSEIVPLGMNKLPIHLQYRDQIRQQQQNIQQVGSPSSSRQPIDLSQLEDLISSKIGVTGLQSEYLFENHQIPDNHTRVIIIVVPMAYDAMITAPSLESATEILRSYVNAGQQAIELSKFLRLSGYEAMVHHPMGDLNEYHHLLIPPHAVSAGLGERGRTGLFIDYELGPNVRLAAVTTNAPLEFTQSDPRGITEFCHRCKYCVRYCPPDALPDGTYLEHVRSGTVMDFKINSHRCFQYFKQHNGCGRCIVHCILAEPDKQDIKRRLNRITNWYEEWVVSGKLDELYQQELQN